MSAVRPGTGSRPGAGLRPAPARGATLGEKPSPGDGFSPRDDYDDFCVFLRKLCGIDLEQYKRPQMERRLRSYYNQRGVSDLRDSFTQLRDPRQLDELLDRITINVSQLWRNPEQWTLLEREILPELATRGRLDAWSAGCSYGAEAYTLAALLHALATRPCVSVRGTDIDRRMVARARDGRFSAEDARTAPPDKLAKGFERDGDGWRARPELRALTRFEFGDLLKLAPPANAFDLILCRNTVIYFTEPIRDELHGRLAAALRPGGYLVVGSTERVADPSALGLTPSHPFIYHKR